MGFLIDSGHGTSGKARKKKTADDTPKPEADKNLNAVVEKLLKQADQYMKASGENTHSDQSGDYLRICALYKQNQAIIYLLQNQKK